MNSIVSQHVISRHPASGKPKIVQVAYSNGKITRVHIHNNGQQTYTTIREGTTRVVPRQVILQQVVVQPQIVGTTTRVVVPRQVIPQQVVVQPQIVGTTTRVVVPRQVIPQQVVVQPQIVYQRVIQRHSITNAPKVVETKYSNGKIIRTHYHNDGRITRE